MSSRPLRTSALVERIRAEIREHGPMHFARFMEHALYDPEGGYYNRTPGPVGREGDFVTASDVGPAFGRCIARQLMEIDRRIGPLAPFDVLEFGAGRGWLARDILDAAAELDAVFARRLRYALVDRSPAMREAALLRVPEARALAPEEVPAGHRGALLAVELFDALPVHRVRRRDERLVEVLVDLSASGDLVEREGPPLPEVRALAERYGAAAAGGEAEVAPRAASLLASMAAALERGVILVVDYGDRADRLYRDAPDGTLLAYHRHATHQDFLVRVGEQDLTAHVNFSALTDRAHDLGLADLGLTTQDRFLIANGILESFEADDSRSWATPRSVKRRLQALQLIHPAGMGRVFKVLALSKGCTAPFELDGMRDPFA